MSNSILRKASITFVRFPDDSWVFKRDCRPEHNYLRTSQNHELKFRGVRYSYNIPPSQNKPPSNCSSSSHQSYFYTATMSSLTYSNDSGLGPEINAQLSTNFHFSQAVTIGDTVKISGQGGWDANLKFDASDLKGQIDLAFQNVDRVLQGVGLRGWEDVYLWRSYVVEAHMEAATPYLIEKMKSRVPGHRPVWTALSVPKLGAPEALVEIEVEAYAPKK
ncbi:hypothetical protein LSUE1_G007369 [Lachnellula suecica]|uniref:Uncharacterized protein n=1 Tax=Lachnellula suecica TaxID=602035 RepID=A0A8T9BZL7_9HELO|nr:hypothetical protein LSUE1_G007369 [Lachnellula suecica]